MARKSSRRDRKLIQERKQHAPPFQVLQEGREKLDAGDAREAIECLRRAQREDSGLRGLDLLLFGAYRQRARELAAKGMAREAAAMRDLAARHHPAIAAQSLSAGDLARYARYADASESVHAYADWLRGQELAPDVERVLADELVASRRWDALEGLDEDHPLRREAEAVRRAVDLMDAGAWDDAGTALAGISRRSPYAPWRVFCKAMASFAVGDDQGLRQALDLMPPQFILGRTVAELRRVCDSGTKGPPLSTPTPLQRALGLGTADSERLARDLLEALRRDPPRWRDVEGLLPPLARSVYPEGPTQAGVSLWEILGIGARQGALPLSDVLALGRLLPAELARAVGARIALVNSPVSHAVWNVAPAATYLAHLKVEFPDPSHQALARARVLEFLARSGHERGACPVCVGPLVQKTLRDLAGGQPGDPAHIFADLMLASLEADPDNREGYSFLRQLLRGQASGRPKMERVLTAMAARFPDDPDPYLELASLHYTRNAYRKGEAALDEARKRAPHDERILDRQAIGYLRSSDQSRGRGNYPLAERDLHRAEALGRRRLVHVLMARRLALTLVSGGLGAMEEVDRAVDPLPPFEQLRVLVLLLLDMASVKDLRGGTLTGVRQKLHSKGELLSRLSGAEIVGLLAPLDGDLSLIFQDLRVAPVLADRWVSLLARVEGDDLIAACDSLLACGARGFVRVEIDRRLSGLAPRDQDPLLRFYGAVVRYLEGGMGSSQEIKTAVNDAPPARREQMRAAAARLAPHAHGPLQEALRQFDFSILDAPRVPLGGMPPELEALLGGAADLPDDGGFPLADDGDVDEALGELEGILDEAGVRGAPLPVLQDFVGLLRSDPLRRRELDDAARAFADRYDDLSRELRVLLFPRRKGKSRQGR